jgi:hypothetical protein
LRLGITSEKFLKIPQLGLKGVRREVFERKIQKMGFPPENC